MKMMLCAGGALFAGLMAPAAEAVVIDFTNTGCTASGVYCLIPQSYGDTADVDVSYRTLNAATGKQTGAGLFEYGQYGDLSKVVYGGTNASQFVGEITLTAKTGRLLSLQSLDFATYHGWSATVPISILDLNGNLLMGGRYATGYPSHRTLTPATQYLSGVVIRWGPDSYNVGLDNITYAVSSPAPEPASWAMAVMGFGAIGWSARNRRKATVRFA